MRAVSRVSARVVSSVWGARGGSLGTDRKGEAMKNLGSQVTAATLVSVACACVLICALNQYWPGALGCLGLAVFGGWVVWAVMENGFGEGVGFGSILGLAGLLTGSFLALFTGPGEMVPGSKMEATPWQMVCWLIGLICAVAGLEKERRPRTPKKTE